MATQKNFREKIADLFRRKPKIEVELAPLSYSRNKRIYNKKTSTRKSMEDERRKELRRKTMELRRRRSRESRRRRSRESIRRESRSRARTDP